MPGSEFVLFGPAHIMALVFTVLAPVVMAWTVRSRWLGANTRTIIAWAFAVVMLLNEVCLRTWMVTVEGKQWFQILPLHLCDMLVYITVAAVFTRSLALYELAYLWGLAGTLNALLTPELPGMKGFPSPWFIMFFVQHGGILVGALYMTWGLNMRPDTRSILKVFGWCQVYLVVVFTLNYLLGTNYGFIMAKPDTPSVLDLLGPWPLYLLAMQVLGMAQFIFWYLPFAYSDWVGVQPIFGANARPLPGRPLDAQENIWNEIESGRA
ncbi:TIGR02206 family membrane protein [Verrucomicrobia bacterium LW23]|nr:TIGR02206 family membrane protein [Verrucomicrobia bacterium LW23]